MADLNLTIMLSRPLVLPPVVPPLPLPPPDLINLVLTFLSWSSLDLSFDDPGSTALNYELDYSTTSNFAPGMVTSVNLPVNLMSNTTFNIIGLNLAMAVYIRVRATNLTGNSNYATATAIAPVPASLLNFGGGALSTTSIVVFWNDPGIWAISYELDYAVLIGFFPGPFTTINIPSSPGFAASYTITGLLPNTQYYFRIRAVNPIGNSAWKTKKISTP
ncbi:MAG: fibronectin type III domain-containing protein [Chitinophagaceae bacterium]|nr:fibronectin type III domain-containing protein [Chitinophagaceae bacterium]